MEKPLGTKAYGHIPHLPDSRMGPGDHKVPDGVQSLVCERLRTNDSVTVTEKLDGSCCAVAYHNGSIYALSRAGYEAKTSPYLQHRIFDMWVGGYDFSWLRKFPEHRVVGEWMIQAHGTKYSLPCEPFCPFDIFDGTRRIPYETTRSLISDYTDLRMPSLVADTPVSVTEAMERLGAGGHGALEPPEGVVYRLETHGEFNLLCKYVNPNKTDGKYLTEKTGGDPVWNHCVSYLPMESLLHGY